MSDRARTVLGWCYKLRALVCCVVGGFAAHWLLSVQDLRVFIVLLVLLFVWWLSAMDYLERKLKELNDGKD